MQLVCCYGYDDDDDRSGVVVVIVMVVAGEEASGDGVCRVIRIRARSDVRARV
jgi:hypothetical protein